MTVLVGYATSHGSTRGIADRITCRLKDRGVPVEMRPVAAVESVAGYDAAVLGSAIHSGHWLAPAADFVRRNGDALAVRPVWLFSVSTLGETSSTFGPRVSARMRKARGETDEIKRWRAELRARDHRDFAGVVRREHWGRAGNLFVRVAGGRYGDHRDWADIDAWADAIASQLAIARAG